MRILVTGSTGFVGRNLVPTLLKDQHQILELTRSKEKSFSLFNDLTIKHQISDDQTDLKTAIQQFNPEIVIHLAALLTASDDYGLMTKLIDSNITFLCRVLDALKGINIKLFVNTGTFAEYFYGDGIMQPAYLYAATKTASRAFLDYYSKSYNFKQTTVVPYTIYGQKDSQKKIIDIILDSIESKIPIDLSPGEQVLDFIHIEDVTKLFLRIIEKTDSLPQKSNILAGTGKGTSLKQLAEIIEEITGEKTKINWGGKPYRNSDVMYAVADTHNMYELWNLLPINSLKLGIKKYISLINDNMQK